MAHHVNRKGLETRKQNWAKTEKPFFFFIKTEKPDILSAKTENDQNRKTENPNTPFTTLGSEMVSLP